MFSEAGKFLLVVINFDLDLTHDLGDLSFLLGKSLLTSFNSLSVFVNLSLDVNLLSEFLLGILVRFL